MPKKKDDDKKKVIERSLRYIADFESSGGKNRRVESIGNTKGTFHIKPSLARSYNKSLKGKSDRDVREYLAANPKIEKDIATKYISKLQSKVSGMDEDAQVGLISFGYNLGEKRIDRILDIKNKEGMDAAREKMLEFNKAKVKGKYKELRGLTKRRESESNLFYKDISDRASLSASSFMESEAPEARLIGSMEEEEDITIMERLLNRSRKE